MIRLGFHPVEVAMRAALICISLAVALAAPTFVDAKPVAVCPQFQRTPITRLAQLPPSIRKTLGAIAEINGRWNVGDAIGPGETHLPFRHLMAAGDMGRGRWLVIWEQGGIALSTNVEVFKLTAGVGGRITATRLVSVQGGPVEPLCRQAAAKLPR
jgi:hypothetical protein